MKRATNNTWRRVLSSGVCLTALLTPLGHSSALAADEASSTDAATAPAAPAAPPEKPKIDVRKLFAMNCSWCHDGYGMHAGKGPKLAGTTMSHEQVYLRIEKGKSGAMPGYGKVLSKDQIQVLADYIKALPSE